MIRLMLAVVVLVAAIFFFVGYWMNGTFRTAPAVTGNETRDVDPPDIKTPEIDTRAVKEKGAELRDQAAVAARRVGTSLEEGGLTAKIKAKMVLDDVVKARNIDVTTSGTAVTLSGTVHSEQERERAVALARETEGVTQVIDRLVVRRI
jgi:hypothetical protein